MFCTECGAEIKSGAKFCGKCGTAISIEEQEEKNDLNQKNQQNQSAPSSTGLNDQGKYDPGLAASRGVKTKSPVPKGYDPGLKRSRRNQQSRQPQRPLYKSDIKVNQAREKSSELPISFLWIVSTILTGIIIQSISSSFNFGIFSFGMAFILPVGAMVTAFINVCIFNLFRIIFRIKPQGNAFLNATLGTFIIILMLANTDPAQSVLSVGYRFRSGGAVSTGAFFGWALRIRNIIGYWIIATSCYDNPGKIFDD